MQTRVVLLSLASTLFVGSCADEPSAPAEASAVAHIEQSIVRGEPAVGRAYDAVGALVASRVIYDQNIGAPRTIVTPFCTASLIARNMVLTAKHCVRTVQGALEDPRTEVVFALGPDALKPTRKVSIATAAAAPNDEGGFVHLGHDVGVVFLGEQVTGVEPLKLATLSDGMVGTRIEAVGFGIRDEARNFGTKQKGLVRITANQGRVFEHALGDFEGFKRWLADDLFAFAGESDTVSLPLHDAGSAPDIDAGPLNIDAGALERASQALPEGLRAGYEGTLLVSGYEAFVGGDAESAQPCSGDSGGPLLKDGKIFAVASSVLRTTKPVCDYGAVYATLGPEVMDFINQARRDPCGGLTSAGACSGASTVKCVSERGSRRLDVRRCAQGALCAVKDGAAQCVQPAAPGTP